MTVETVKMSSKGQVVIPQNVREALKAGEGSIFAVITSSDSVILKKIKTPSKDELINDLKKIAIEGTKRAKKLGIKEEDMSKLVEKSRRK